jgi:hypothetical protein
MNVIPQSTDDGSKRWLIVLAVTAAVSVSFLVYSFVKTLSPPEQSVVAPQKPAAWPAEETVTRVEPDWNSATAGHAAEGSRAPARGPDPFAAQNAAAAKAAAANDPVATQKAVHQQAEYLRNLISKGKLPEGFGKLTKEQVDDMEKNEVLIN